MAEGFTEFAELNEAMNLLFKIKIIILEIEDLRDEEVRKNLYFEAKSLFQSLIKIKNPISISEVGDVPEEFICPLSQRLIHDPVILHPCRETFDEKFVSEWLYLGLRLCPICSVDLTSIHVDPLITKNEEVANSIDNWRKDHFNLKNELYAKEDLFEKARLYLQSLLKTLLYSSLDNKIKAANELVKVTQFSEGFKFLIELDTDGITPFQTIFQFRQRFVIQDIIELLENTSPGTELFLSLLKLLCNVSTILRYGIHYFVNLKGFLTAVYRNGNNKEEKQVALSILLNLELVPLFENDITYEVKMNKYSISRGKIIKQDARVEI
ncbi:hypothetical protein FRX31_019426 [Thalictrum thalictroides]|uniref:U-box domain-containing protein n=1 Tax=Thalictrum thalictroides TaxID=46969 RepID=A0A7J6W3T2_THATH|nr:hypothetical protein FRX31_019426 [Thalictrum thalictroides]